MKKWTNIDYIKTLNSSRKCFELTDFYKYIGFQVSLENDEEELLSALTEDNDIVNTSNVGEGDIQTLA